MSRVGGPRFWLSDGCRRGIFAVAALVLLWECRPALAQEVSGLAQQTPDPAAELTTLERELATALHTQDEGALDRLLAPDYVLRGSPDIDRATWLRNALTLCWGDHSDLSSVQVQRYADVAVTSFELTFYIDPETCRPVVLRSLITDVWVRGSAGWRLQVRHAAPPPRGGIAAQYGAVPEVPLLWDVKSELSLVATGGTTSVRTLGLGSTVIHRTTTTTTRGSVAFLTSEVESVTNARSLTVLGRHGVDLRPRLALFGEASYAQDRFAGIDSRIWAAAGAAYTAPLPRRHGLIAEGSLGYTAEQRLDGMDRRFPTAIGNLRYRWSVATGTEFSQDVGVNADLDTARNWRGTSATAFTITLNSLLSFKMSHMVEYRNAPVRGFGRTDLETTAALVFSMQRR